MRARSSIRVASHLSQVSDWDPVGPFQERNFGHRNSRDGHKLRARARHQNLNATRLLLRNCGLDT